MELESTPKEGEVQDVKKTAEECEHKLEEVEGTVQRVLWRSFGYPELSLSLNLLQVKLETGQERQDRNLTSVTCCQIEANSTPAV